MVSFLRILFWSVMTPVGEYAAKFGGIWGREGTCPLDEWTEVSNWLVI